MLGESQSKTERHSYFLLPLTRPLRLIGKVHGWDDVMQDSHASYEGGARRQRVLV